MIRLRDVTFQEETITGMKVVLPIFEVKSKETAEWNQSFEFEKDIVEEKENSENLEMGTKSNIEERTVEI